MRAQVGIALFAALAAALGFLFAFIPNIELFTFCLFASGYVQGARGGLASALLAATIYFGLNPYGSSLMFPALFVSQLLAAALISLLGTLFGLATRLPGFRADGASLWRRLLIIPFAAPAALLLTLLPTLGFALVGGGEWRGWLFLGGLMTAWGFIFNMIVFLTCFELLARQTRRLGVRDAVRTAEV